MTPGLFEACYTWFTTLFPSTPIRTIQGSAAGACHCLACPSTGSLERHGSPFWLVVGFPSSRWLIAVVRLCRCCYCTSLIPPRRFDNICSAAVALDRPLPRRRCATDNSALPKRHKPANQCHGLGKPRGWGADGAKQYRSHGRAP